MDIRSFTYDYLTPIHRMVGRTVVQTSEFFTIT